MRVGEFACMGDGSAWSAWLDVVYMKDRRVRLRTTSRAWGGVGRRVRRRGDKSCSHSARASRFARVPLQRRYGGSGAYAPMKRLSCVVSLAYACCRCDGFGFRVITHDFACVGGGEGSFVCQFACCVFAIVGVSAVCACAWSRGCSFACLLRLRDLWVLWYLWYLRTCMFACLQCDDWSRV